MNPGSFAFLHRPHWRLWAARLLLLAGSLYLLYLVRQILLPFGVALAVAYLLHPLVAWGERLRLSRSLAILLVYLTVALSLYLTFTFGLPRLLDELNTLAASLPLYIGQVQDWLLDLYRGIRRVPMPEALRQVFEETSMRMELSLIGLLRQVAENMVALMSHAFTLILVPVLAYYLLKDLDRILQWGIRLIPVGWRDEVVTLVQEMDKVLMQFVRGHLLVALIIGSATAVGLALLQVRFALLLGIIAGLANIIPYFGPIIGSLPALAVALLDSKTKALYVLLLMITIQQIENSVLSPKIIGNSVGLHPLVVIFVLLAGGHLWGLIGLILAVPMAAVAKIALAFCWRRLGLQD